MEVKNVTIAIVVVAVTIAASLAFLGDKKILGAQYRRYTSLVEQADQLFSGKNYSEASKNYKQALIIDPRDAKVWARYEQSEKKAILGQVGATLPAAAPRAAAPHNETITPQVPVGGGMIIEEDEGC